MAWDSPLDQRIINGIAVVVTVVWAVSFMADIFIAGYDPSPFIHLTMMTIVGAAMGTGFVRKNGDNDP